MSRPRSRVRSPKIQQFSRPPLVRMLQLHQQLQAGSFPNCRKLADELEVSTKTIQRDSRYTGEPTTWATVTPFILPGYDNPRKLRRALSPNEDATAEPLNAEGQKRLLSTLDRRTDFLLRKAIRQAGFPDELAEHAEIDWSGSGFWPGTDLAGRYAIPATLRRFRRLHVRISWRDAAGAPIAVTGPMCIGSGRFVGLGLFAPLRAG